MGGMVKNYFAKVDETTEVYEALSEFVDNSIDANGINVDITLDRSNNNFRCIDNGSGMTRLRLKKYASSFSSSIGKGGRKAIGIYGVGSKDAIIKLANHKNGATASIVTWTDKRHVNCLQFTLNDNDEKRFVKPTLLDEYESNDLPYESGTIITIHNIKPIPKGSQWNSQLKTSVGGNYAYLKPLLSLKGKSLSVTINGEKIDFGFDRMHLLELGDIVEKEGIHQIDNKFSVVVSYKRFTNVSNSNASIVIPIVGLLINREYAMKHPLERHMHACGLYAIKGDRYVMYGDFKGGNIRGGMGYGRVLIGVDGNEELLELGRNKSKGIKIDNEKINEYLDDDGCTLAEVVKKIMTRFGALNEFQTSGCANRPISQELLEKAFRENIGRTSLIRYYNEHICSIPSEMGIALGNCDEDVTEDDIIASANKIKDEIVRSDGRVITNLKFSKNKETRVSEVSSTKQIFVGEVEELLHNTFMFLYNKSGKHCSQAELNHAYNSAISLFLEKHPTSKLILANSVNAASR